jgi:hypothetical protein
MEIDDLIKCIRSVDIKQQLSSLESAIEIVKRIARESVQSIENSQYPLFVAERVIQLGSVVVDYLEEKLSQVEKPEERMAISLSLLHFGSRSGVPYLLEAIGSSDEYAPLISQKLAQARIAEVAEKITSKLRSTDIRNFDLIVSLLIALRTLNIKLPSDIKQRLSADDVPWQVRTLLEGDT